MPKPTSCITSVTAKRGAPVPAAPYTHLTNDGREVHPLLLWRRGLGRGGPPSHSHAPVWSGLPVGCLTNLGGVRAENDGLLSLALSSKGGEGNSPARPSRIRRQEGLTAESGGGGLTEKWWTEISSETPFSCPPCFCQPVPSSPSADVVPYRPDSLQPANLEGQPLVGLVLAVPHQV
jgi:hypothetical protein